jgi:Domain of unknown function (DUF1788)
VSRIEDLAENFGRHIATPWQRTIAGAQRVIMIVYDKELERSLRARKQSFEAATQAAGHEWAEIDLSDSFARWMADDEYREEYFASPDDIQLKIAPEPSGEFTQFLVKRLRDRLASPDITDNTVVGVLGAGALYGFARISTVLKEVEPAIRGRLAVFFPGQFEANNYRLLDARDGWNYLAVPISLRAEGEVA